MILKNLFVTPLAFKLGISLTGELLRNREAEVEDGALLVTGNARRGIALRISQVAGRQLVDIATLPKEMQVQLLERVKKAIERARLAAVFLYEACWKRATLRSELKACHRLETLPREVQRRHRRVDARSMYHLGARAVMA